MKSQEDEICALLIYPISMAMADKVTEENDDMEENKTHLVKPPQFHAMDLKFTVDDLIFEILSHLLKV
jgi:hypothetical protein